MKVAIINESLNPLPKYAKQGDAGMDLMADFSKRLDDKYFDYADWDAERKVLLIFPGGRALVPTNLYTAIPEGYEIQIRPRSGLALKQGISVLNTPGTIDSSFRGGWGVILINLSDSVFEVKQGDRIAQAVLHKFETIEWSEVKNLTESDRDTTGFGDSGVGSLAQ